MGRVQRRKYLSGLDKLFHLLSVNPRLAPERYEFSLPIRIHHYEQHLIFYMIEDDRILIVRVLQENADIDRHL
jgi:toxin ParE1/3/4